MNDQAQPPTLARLMHDFLLAAGALATRVVDEAAATDPELLEAVRRSVTQGEHLVISQHLGDEPKVEMAAQGDYETRRLIATLPMPAPPTHGGH